MTAKPGVNVTSDVSSTDVMNYLLSMMIELTDDI